MKLYKNTLIISTIFFCVCVLLSIIFEFTYISRYQIFSVLSDYMIGVACSIIVVIITTFVQFKYEQKKQLNAVLMDIEFFLFHCVLIAMSLNPNEEMSDNTWEYYYDQAHDDTKKISLELSNIEWFSKNNIKIASDLQMAVLNIRVELIKCSGKPKRERLIDTIRSSYVKEIKDNAILLANDNDRVVKNIIENYDKIEDELNK